MTKGIITLSNKEIDQLSVIQSTINPQLKLTKAVTQLGLSVRQVKRLVQAYRTPHLWIGNGFSMA